MGTVEETIRIIEGVVDSRKSPIVWLTGDAGSVVLVQLVTMIKRCPVLIFPKFWDKEEKEFITKVIERFDLTAYYFDPVKAELSGNTIISEYETDCLRYFHPQKADLDMWEKLIEFEGEKHIIPSYLWDATFAHPPIDVEVAGKTELIYPLAKWTRSEIADAFKDMEIH